MRIVQALVSVSYSHTLSMLFVNLKCPPHIWLLQGRPSKVLLSPSYPWEELIIVMKCICGLPPLYIISHYFIQYPICFCISFINP